MENESIYESHEERSNMNQPESFRPRYRDSTKRHIPSVNLALPPVGWHRTLVHEEQMTTVCACEKTVVMAKQPMWHGRGKSLLGSGGTLIADAPGHLTSMKYEFGDCTKRLSLCRRASAGAEGLRRSTARVC